MKLNGYRVISPDDADIKTGKNICITPKGYEEGIILRLKDMGIGENHYFLYTDMLDQIASLGTLEPRLPKYNMCSHSRIIFWSPLFLFQRHSSGIPTFLSRPVSLHNIRVLILPISWLPIRTGWWKYVWMALMCFAQTTVLHILAMAGLVSGKDMRD